MRILVYEYVTGGGWYCHSEQAPPDSLRCEGRAMLRALGLPTFEVDGTLQQASTGGIGSLCFQAEVK